MRKGWCSKKRSQKEAQPPTFQLTHFLSELESEKREFLSSLSLCQIRVKLLSALNVFIKLILISFRLPFMAEIKFKWPSEIRIRSCHKRPKSGLLIRHANNNSYRPNLLIGKLKFTTQKWLNWRRYRLVSPAEKLWSDTLAYDFEVN